MRRAFSDLGTAALTLAVLAGSAAAQEKKPEAAPPPGQEMPLAKAGPEHELLKKDVGVWDATIELMEPGGKAQVSKGVETGTLVGDGLWIIQDFKGEMMGMPFQGHGVTGYDPFKKKYVGTWVDSMSAGITTTEGTRDPKTRRLTMQVEGPGPDGTMMKMRSTSEWKDADTRVFTMYSPAGQGEEFVMMKITYKRRSTAAAPRPTN